jgi:hypothetical protein
MSENNLGTISAAQICKTSNDVMSRKNAQEQIRMHASRPSNKSDTANKERANKPSNKPSLDDRTQMSSNGNNQNKLSEDKTCAMPKSSNELRSLCQTPTSPNVRIPKKPKTVYYELESIHKMPSELMSICQPSGKSKLCYTNINVRISRE